MGGLDTQRLVLIRSTVKDTRGREKYLHGTGYFVTDELVLTAHHVVSEGTPKVIKIRVETGAPQWRDAEPEPIWQNSALDAALLKVALPLNGVEPLHFADAPFKKNEPWESAGYPHASTQEGDDGTERKVAGLKGTLYRWGGGGQGLPELELSVDDAPVDDGWKGISGAPVFVGDKLVGIIKSSLAAYDATRLAGVRIDQLLREPGFQVAIAPKWLEPSPNKTWFLLLIPEIQDSEGDKLKDYVSAAIRYKSNEIRHASGLEEIDEKLRVVIVTEALESRERWLQFVQALCTAPVMVVDVTGFQPAVMLILGIRAAVRRGVTVTTTLAKLNESHLSDLPFNIQETKLVYLSDSHEANDPGHPLNRISNAIVGGLTQLKVHPRYLDLPVYDAVRCQEPKESSGMQTPFDTLLMLCSFHKSYKKHYLHVSNNILRKAVNPKPLVRMLDIMSPRLVGQALYEYIRWARCCIVDWTHWRPNVFFELGVRLACSDIGPISLIEESEIHNDVSEMSPSPKANLPMKTALLKQKEQLIELLDPITYKLKGTSEPFEEVWSRYESYIGEDTLPVKLSTLVHNETYRTIGLTSYDWTQEPITKPPHEELRASVETQLGKDPQKVGNFPVLFSSHPQFSRELLWSARERWIAAWYYFRYRYSLEEFKSNEELRKQLISLGNQVDLWLQNLSDHNYKRICNEINSLIDELKRV